MKNEKIEYSQVGVVRSPFTQLEGMPIQPSGAAGALGTIEVFDEFQAGLKDLDAFSHLFLLYHFHRCNGFELHTTPFLDKERRGVFATRVPKRPNPIGLSVVKLVGVERGIVHIENVDILDGTPLIDIKPYVPSFDTQTNVKAGWLEQAQKKVVKHKSDDRFV